MKEHELDAALEAAPRNATLPRDPWPAIEWGMDEQSRRRVHRAWAAAAAVVLFAVGAGAGFAVGHGWTGTGAAGSFSSTPAFLAAARVQAAGSDYLAAVAALQQIDREEPGRDPAAVGQGYEATLAVLQTLAETVEHSAVGGGQVGALAAEAARVRAAVDARVTRLIANTGAGGAP